MAACAPVDIASHQLLPAAAEVLEQVFDALQINDIGNVQATSRHTLAVAEERRSRVLKRRNMEAFWSWRKAHAVESALFFDMLGSPSLWALGPNQQHHNVIEEGNDNDGSPWLQLSGGTDWQAFQGGFRCISQDGIRPTWVTFRVRIATPELSCAFLTFAAAQCRWGLEDIVLGFNYSGDENAQRRRCFTVQTGATQNGGSSMPIHVEPEIVANQAYQVSIHCDWASSAMSVFVDGVKYVDSMPLRTARPIIFTALFNWRSGARTAFSELMLGDTCPCELCDASVWRTRSLAQRARSACCKRRPPPNHESQVPSGPSASPWTTRKSSWTARKTLFATATIGCVAAVAVQQFVVASL